MVGSAEEADDRELVAAHRAAGDGRGHQRRPVLRRAAQRRVGAPGRRSALRRPVQLRALGAVDRRSRGRQPGDLGHRLATGPRALHEADRDPGGLHLPPARRLSHGRVSGPRGGRSRRGPRLRGPVLHRRLDHPHLAGRQPVPDDRRGQRALRRGPGREGRRSRPARQARRPSTGGYPSEVGRPRAAQRPCHPRPSASRRTRPRRRAPDPASASLPSRPADPLAPARRRRSTDGAAHERASRERGRGRLPCRRRARGGGRPRQRAELAAGLSHGVGRDQPVRVQLQKAGFGTTVPDPGADPYCVDFDKTHQNVDQLGVVDFLSNEPARVAAATPKCFYFQSDHWRGSIVQANAATKTYEWDGHYFFDKARGDGGAWVTNFNINGHTGDPTTLPGIPGVLRPVHGPRNRRRDQPQQRPRRPVLRRAGPGAPPSRSTRARPEAWHRCGASPARGRRARHPAQPHRPVAFGDPESKVRALLGPPYDVRLGFLRYCQAGAGKYLVGALSPSDQPGAGNPLICTGAHDERGLSRYGGVGRGTSSARVRRRASRVLGCSWPRA